MSFRIFVISLTVGVALFATSLAQAAPGGSLTTVRSYDVAFAGARALQVASPQGTFDLIGVHWQGHGSVEVRTGRGGRWGPWLGIADDVGPDPRTAEAARSRGWRVGEGLWVGGSTRFQVRRRGEVRRARVFTVRSRVSRVPLRTTAAAGQPPIVTRSQWLADESLRRDDPTIAPTLRFAIVHHTAGPNSYTREQAPAVVRAIMAYHVQSNGWDDIGYNALVDRFGTVYEGRYGGIDQNVVGAHAKGFNTGSFGIAVLGEFTTAAPAKAATDALALMIAWRLDLAHVDPLSSLTATSGGSERFQPGVPVLLRAVSGHRDTGLTSCPGDQLYARLPAIAKQAAAIGLPKIFEPVLSGTWGGVMTLSARLSAGLPWRVSVKGDDGTVAADVTGTGTAITASWETAGLPGDRYTWRVESAGATPVTGVIDSTTAPAALALAPISVDNPTISPNGDGLLDSATISYRLSRAATVGATVVDFSGAQVAELEPPRWRRAGDQRLVFDGQGLADGSYDILLEARSADGQAASSAVTVAITRTLSAVSLSDAVLTPNGDGRSDVLGVRFTLAGPATVRLRMLREGRWVTTPFDGPLAAGPQTLEWDGTKPTGRVREGAYAAVLDVSDAVATMTVSLPFLADWTPPRIKLVSSAPPVIGVSEPATLRVVVNGLWRRLEVTAPGRVRLPWVRQIRTLLVVATDRAGNRTEFRAPAAYGRSALVVSAVRDAAKSHP